MRKHDDPAVDFYFTLLTRDKWRLILGLGYDDALDRDEQGNPVWMPEEFDNGEDNTSSVCSMSWREIYPPSDAIEPMLTQFAATTVAVFPPKPLLETGWPDEAYVEPEWWRYRAWHEQGNETLDMIEERYPWVRENELDFTSFYGWYHIQGRSAARCFAAYNHEIAFCDSTPEDPDEPAASDVTGQIAAHYFALRAKCEFVLDWFHNHCRIAGFLPHTEQRFEMPAEPRARIRWGAPRSHHWKKELPARRIEYIPDYKSGADEDTLFISAFEDWKRQQKPGAQPAQTTTPTKRRRRRRKR